MILEELQKEIEKIGIVAHEYGMSAQEFCEFLKKLSTEPIILSDKDIFVDNDKIWVISNNIEKPIKLVIERDKEERWDWLDDTDG